jgi:hypothetical protein
VSLAVLLGALNIALPGENLMFMVGDENMPWVPVVIPGIVGVALRVTSSRASHHHRWRPACFKS